MKKAIIVGAASLTMAALPVFGVFATNPEPVIDNITISVGETCTVSRATSGGSGSYTATMSIDDLEEGVGSTTFEAVCNNAGGFVITATPTALSGPAGSEAINYSATTPTAGTGTWTATKSSTGENIAATGGILMSASGSTTGQSETVTYKISTRANQAKGDYQGTMTYQLTQN